MSDLQVNKEALPSPSSTVWCLTQNVVQVEFEWTIQQFAFLNSFENWGRYHSAEFSHKKTDQWFLELFDDGQNMNINLNLINYTHLSDPIRVKIAIFNKKREKIFPRQHCLPKNTISPSRISVIEKKMLLESECLVNGNLTIYCEIESFITKPPKHRAKLANSLEKPFSNSDQLVAQLEELFENMKFPDITINVRGRQFKAHKSILATRSQFFAAMFDHPTKEKLTNQVEVEDVDPTLFNEILRFIYTGRLSELTMGKMASNILAVADKYLLDQFKMECEIHIINQMSAENCLELLLVTDEHHPAFHLKKYAVEFFRFFPSEVMETDDWNKAKQDDPEQCFSVLKEFVKSLD